MRRHLEDDILGPPKAHDGSAHVVGVALVVVMRVSRRQINRNVVPVVHLEFDAEGGFVFILRIFFFFFMVEVNTEHLQLTLPTVSRVAGLIWLM